MLHAERPQKIALRIAAGRGENLGADLLGDLNRRQADAAGAGVNQHRSPGCSWASRTRP